MHGEMAKSEKGLTKVSKYDRVQYNNINTKIYKYPQNYKVIKTKIMIPVR